MKYLKTYKIFESHIEVDEVKDMLSYLSDDQFNIQVAEGEHHVYPNCIEITISKDGGNFYFWNEGDIGELTPFTIAEVKEYLLRTYKYMVSEGWYSFNFEIVTYDKLDSTLSRKFRNDTFHTPVGIDDEGIYITVFSDRKFSPEHLDSRVKDEEKILCIYIGLGKY